MVAWPVLPSVRRGACHRRRQSRRRPASRTRSVVLCMPKHACTNDWTLARPTSPGGAASEPRQSGDSRPYQAFAIHGLYWHGFRSVAWVSSVRPLLLANRPAECGNQNNKESPMKPLSEPTDASVCLVSSASVLPVMAHGIYCARAMSCAAIGDAACPRRQA